MHRTVLECWVVLPALIVSALALVSSASVLPSSSSASSSSSFSSSFSSTFGGSSRTAETQVYRTAPHIQSLHTDQNSAQASFYVSCLDTSASPDPSLNHSFLFNLEAFPSDQACGFSNLSLNGVPLVQDWESTGVHAQGLATIPSSGHDLDLVLRSDCLQDTTTSVQRESSAASSTSQLLSVSIESTNHAEACSFAGFTLSFKQYPLPQLLRLSLEPDSTARDFPNSEAWRDPPQNLLLSAASVADTAAPVASPAAQLSLAEQLAELRLLEAEADNLIRLIEQKKDFINSQLPTSSTGLKEKIKGCDSFSCVIKTIGHHIQHAAEQAYHRLHGSNQAYTKWQNSAGGQSPTMMTPTDGVAIPEQAHCHETKPGSPTTVTSPSEKSPANNTSLPRPNGSQWKDASRPPILLIILKFLLVITGLAFLFNLIKRCCISDRKRVDRAAERERRATERLYKCAARKQSWRDWWHGRKRGKPGYRPGDFDEKRGYIIEQEKILEGAMQVEIQQLRIQEEIRQLRNTRDAVHDLVRAEEGRSTIPPAYVLASSSSSSSSHPHGFHPLPAPINIPQATSAMYPAYQHDYQPGTPMSRTSSLPDYKTEASSEPPGYESDRRSSFSDHDGFEEYAYSEYARSTHTIESAWSAGSSIPDLSPRHSGETYRTIETVETTRTFL